MKKKNTKAPATSKQIDESIQLVAQAAAKLGTVPRLTPKERKSTLKLRRGAHQVIPQITSVAAKYSVGSSTVTSDSVNASLAHAQALEPLLNAAALLHETLIDAHLGAQRDAWKGATSLYGMVSNASNADENIANELQPAKEWFKRRRAPKKGVATPPATPAIAAATTSAPAPVTAPVAAKSPAVVTSSAPAPVATAASPTPSTTASPQATPAAPVVAPAPAQ
jgi:hypothetical protein